MFALRETRDGQVYRYDVEDDGVALSRIRFWERMRDDAGLRALLATKLADAPFPSYFWETPPLPADRPFGFVLVDAPSLVGVRPDRRAFAGQFASGPISVGPNLSGDAWLVIPAPSDGLEFPDLARFSRTAPPALVDRLWQEVAGAVVRWTETRDDPVWVSTSGLGVHWLHVRLDTRPKYYSYAPFRSP